MKLYVNSAGQFVTLMPTKKRKSRSAGTAKLKKIVSKAKKIYNGGKGGMKWTTAIKKAAKMV